MKDIDIVNYNGKSFIATIKKVDSAGRILIPFSFREPLHLDKSNLITIMCKKNILTVVALTNKSDE